MRIVLDTNILISAYIARSGTCAALYEHIATVHTSVSSEPLLAEFCEKLIRIPALSFPIDLAHAARDLVRSRTELVTVEPLAHPVCRDPDDDVVLATASCARCAIILTMDKDLLVLRKFAGVAILHPRDFWAFEVA